MIAQMYAVANTAPIGTFADAEDRIELFDGNVAMGEILDYFSTYAADAVLITEEAVVTGILTLKDMVKALQKLENLLLPVRHFMTSPLQTFHEAHSVSDVLSSIRDAAFDKIVITYEDKAIRMVDRHHLLSHFYNQLVPLIQHEYTMIESLLGLVDADERDLLELATTDSLTGIGNRRLLEDIIRVYQEHGEPKDTTLYLVMFDIDDFKSINDTFGHNIGDLVLKHMVGLVGRLIQPSDVFVRWGGEEFVLLLRNVDSKKAMSIAEEIRRAIDLHSFESIVHVTCSFGVTPVRLDENFEEAVERVDRALYHAKSDGKNTVRSEM